MISRRTFVKSAVAAGSVMLSQPLFGQVESSATKPNILFILADDLGYGDLGCYGQTAIQTPNLDNLAASGVRSTDCYAGSTVCAPSRCSLMTGLHSGHSRIRGNSRLPLLPEDRTVAEVLKQAGYATGLIGKWGLGNPGSTGVPNLQGFDEFFGYLDQGHAHNYYPEHLWHNQEMVELEKNLGMARGVYSHDLFTTKALEFIRERHERPFYLYLAYTIPHANNELGRETGNGMEVPNLAPYEDKDWSPIEKGKAAMITRLDRDVGRLMDLLTELGIEGNTVVFFSSDNGPHHEGGVDPTFFKSSGPLRGIKRDLTEGGIRVPMIARWPGKIQAGTTSNHVWAFWDFLPTAAELAGVTPPANLDGISVVPALLGKPSKDHEFLYWEFHEKGSRQAVRMGEWKAIRPTLGEPLELYNLTSDIGEANNIAAAHPDVVGKIETYLKTARTESENWPMKEAG